MSSGTRLPCLMKAADESIENARGQRENDSEAGGRADARFRILHLIVGALPGLSPIQPAHIFQGARFSRQRDSR